MKMKVHMRLQPRRSDLPEKPLPPKMEMAKNIATAIAQEAAAIKRGVPPVPEEEKERRRAICESNKCGQYRASDARCAMCGCWKDNKVAWRSQHCPQKLW